MENREGTKDAKEDKAWKKAMSVDFSPGFSLRVLRAFAVFCSSSRKPKQTSVRPGSIRYSCPVQDFRFLKGAVMATIVRRFAWSQVVLSSLTLSAAAASPEKPAGPLITPSPDITHFTAPLDREGYVDFHAALNAELSKGVSPEENAAIPLLRALGPCEGNRETINLVLKALNAAPWTPGMVDFREFGDVTRGNENGVSQRLNDEYTAAQEVPWTATEHPEIAALLTENEAALAAIALAVQKPKYFRPMVVSKPEDTLVAVLLPDIQISRDVARQLVARAMLNLGEGRPVEAQRDLMTTHQLGRCVGKGATLIEALVGIAIDAVASHADNVWAAHPDLTADQIAAYRQQLAGLPSATDMLRCIDTCERAMCLDVTQAIARGRFNNEAVSFDELLGLTTPGQQQVGIDVGEFAKFLMVMSVDWNVTLRTLNKMYDDLVGAARIADRAQRTDRLVAWEQQLKRTRAETVSTKGIVSTLLGGSNSRGKTFGNVLGTLLMPSVKQALTAQDRSASRVQLTQTMLAIAEFQRREGTFPPSLAALSPQYLAAVPDDLLTGKPFRYTSDGSSYRLYSFGANQRDDNGRMGGEDGADDVLMAYPPPMK
jgi:hypothetical protein